MATPWMPARFPGRVNQKWRVARSMIIARANKPPATGPTSSHRLAARESASVSGASGSEAEMAKRPHRKKRQATSCASSDRYGVKVVRAKKPKNIRKNTARHIQAGRGKDLPLHRGQITGLFRCAQKRVQTGIDSRLQCGQSISRPPRQRRSDWPRSRRSCRFSRRTCGLTNEANRPRADGAQRRRRGVRVERDVRPHDRHDYAVMVQRAKACAAAGASTTRPQRRQCSQRCPPLAPESKVTRRAQG